MTLAPGTQLGPYKVVSLLGAGGMGEVYRATDSRLGRDVALKVLPQTFSSDADRLARFERESRAVAALSHPNVLAIYDVGSQAGLAFAAMELLEGQTLRERLAAGALPVRQTINYGVQLARGLAAAHDKGVVHRDLKPENIFLLSGGHAKILDFGLARIGAEASAAATSTALTDVGAVLGTAAYMSPEQVRGEPADPRSDLFALGAVIYEMLAGVRAFGRETAAETMAAILNDDPPAVVLAGSELPPALDRTIRHCLEKDRRERFQTARDVAFALETLSGPATSTSGIAQPAVEPRRKSGLVMAAVAIGLVTLGIGTTALRRTPPSQPQPQVDFIRRTFDRQYISRARFMPDGRRIVFSATRPGRPTEILELPDGALSPRVVGHGRLLSVSAKGELAVLLEAVTSTNRESMGTLARMMPEGSPRPVVEDVTEADWSPDGEAFAVVRRLGGIHRLEYPVGMVLATSNGYLSDVRVAPDGTHVAFMDHATENDNRGSIKVVDTTGAIRTVAGEFSGEQGLAWSPDGSRVLASVARNSVSMAIETFAVAGPASPEPPAPAVSVPGSFTILDCGRDGQLLAAIDDGFSGVGVKLPGAAHRNLSWLDLSWDPSLSRDGKYLLFTNARNGGRGGETYAIMLRQTDGSAPARLGEGASLGISPDGTWALAATVQANPPRLVAYPVGAGEPIVFPRGAIGTYYNEMPAVWTHDGQAFLFWGAETNRAPRTYLQPLKGGDPRPVLPDGVRAVLASPDGRHIIGAETDGVWKSYPLDGGAAQILPGLKATTAFAVWYSSSAGDYPIGWTEDGRAVLVAAGTTPLRLERVDVTTGAREKVGEVGADDADGMQSYVVVNAAEDGRQYAYRFARGQSTLYQVRGVPFGR